MTRCSRFEWYAEIQDHGNWHTVWMIGEGLKHGSFPGGHIYETPELMAAEIIKALEKLNN